ncbi:MAG: hypothetical protein QXL94_00990 [Candidatus Parvarchaeum sp.]
MTGTTENIEKAKLIAEAVKQLDMPETAKRTVITQAAMGVPVDAVINNIADISNSIATQKAEIETPKLQMPKSYTPIERQIAKMLIENTGVDMLDSGGHAGRHWQMNRAVADFRKRPVIEIETEVESNQLKKLPTYNYDKNQTELKNFKSVQHPIQKTTVKHTRVNVPLMQKALPVLDTNTPIIIQETGETVKEIEKELQTKKKENEKERLRA